MPEIRQPVCEAYPARYAAAVLLAAEPHIYLDAISHVLAKAALEANIDTDRDEILHHSLCKLMMMMEYLVEYLESNAGDAYPVGYKMQAAIAAQSARESVDQFLRSKMFRPKLSDCEHPLFDLQVELRREINLL